MFPRLFASSVTNGRLVFEVRKGKDGGNDDTSGSGIGGQAQAPVVYACGFSHCSNNSWVLGFLWALWLLLSGNRGISNSSNSSSGAPVASWGNVVFLLCNPKGNSSFLQLLSLGHASLVLPALPTHLQSVPCTDSPFIFNT